MIALIVILPFLSALLMGVVYLGNTDMKRHSFFTVVGIASPLISSLLSLCVLAQLINGAKTIHSTLFEWIHLGAFQISVAFMADSLSVIMISFITVIGTIIHIYASGYMKGDAGYGKFFSYFNFFMGSMLLLVLADNPIIMFIGWELVGLSSYLLIGYYHQDASNMKAANKAFILNRVGDFGFVIAIVLLFLALEGDGFTFENIQANISLVDHNMLTLIGVLLFVGAMGKSAQIPLYVWLPDAMAGPTPVSALIHAATMVTAGVYMVARYSFLYELIPHVGVFIASVGAASALFAAIIASYQSDIKKILAYSTISQLGYMFIAVGLGAYSSGIFHVFTHAFFKALLFMGAGAVIVALHHEQNIFKMGGLKVKLKLVYITMFIATLSISGIPPFAGFFSKDAIIVTAFAQEHYTIWAVATLTAGLTSFYMFRLFFTVFYSNTTFSKELSSLPRSMTYPLVFLAFGSAFAGFIAPWFSSFLSLSDIAEHVSHTTEYTLAFLNIVLSILAMILAYKMFATDAQEAQSDTFAKRVIINKFYIDELYETIILKPILHGSSFIANIIDPKIFDAFLNFNVWGYKKSATLFATLQNGKVRYYALYIVAGISAMSLYILLKLGEL